MSNLVINDLEIVETLNRDAMSRTDGGSRYSSPLSFFAVPYRRPGSLASSQPVYIGELNQYFVNTDHFEVNQNAIVDVDAIATDGSNLNINLLLDQAGLG